MIKEGSYSVKLDSISIIINGKIVEVIYEITEGEYEGCLVAERIGGKRDD